MCKNDTFLVGLSISFWNIHPGYACWGETQELLLETLPKNLYGADFVGFVTIEAGKSHAKIESSSTHPALVGTSIRMIPISSCTELIQKGDRGYVIGKFNPKSERYSSINKLRVEPFQFDTIHVYVEDNKKRRLQPEDLGVTQKGRLLIKLKETN